MTDSAQSSKSQNADGENLSGQTVNPPQQTSQPRIDPSYGALANKEHAPVEHVRPSDPLETVPEIPQEVKEHGIEARTDEAKLELTRAHSQTGLSHSPASQTVSDHLNGEKPEFPMTPVEVENNRKKSASFSIRWFAEEVLKAMKGGK